MPTTVSEDDAWLDTLGFTLLIVGIAVVILSAVAVIGYKWWKSNHAGHRDGSGPYSHANEESEDADNEQSDGLLREDEHEDVKCGWNKLNAEEVIEEY